jgi:hypothetical protein
MAPRKNNFIPDMRETRYKTETFANPYAPAAPKPFNFATARGGSSINASNGYRTPQNLDPNRNIGGTYRMTNMGLELSKNGQIESLNGQFYRPANNRERYLGLIDSRPGWMGQQDLANANRATYGSATPNAGQLAYEMIGVGYDKSGKFGVDPVNLGVGIALAGSGKLFRGALGAVEKYQGAKLATKLAQFDAEIIANRTAIRAAGRAAADVRQTARRARKSTNVRAARLQRVEASLKDSRPEVAERFGDRAYVMTRGAQISSDMAASPTIGAGRKGTKGAFSFPNADSPLAGSHHRYTPLKDAWPSGEVYYPGRASRGSNDATEWLVRTAGASDSYGRTGVERLSGMYSGRVPKGGWSVRPNLRKNKPWPTNYPEDFETNIIKIGEMADGYYKDQVVSLLDEASSFRNRAAWRLQSDPKNRAVFPRIYDWVTEPSWAPESYQVRVFRAAEEAAKNRKAIPAPKRKIKGGGK